MKDTIKEEDLEKVSGWAGQDKEPSPYAVSEACIGCGACIHVCPVEAIHMGDNYTAYIDEMCVGCGNCAQECPTEAIHKR